jgi:archaellum component FlaF (FlaF/FlaG flagellin family)
MKKRGISSLVAITLIISFVIIIAALTTAWLTGFFEETKEETALESKRVMECSVLNLVINGIYNPETQTIKVRVENNNDKQIEGFVFRKYIGKKVMSTSESKYPISPHGIKIYDVGGGSNVIGVLPKMKINEEIVVCREEYKADVYIVDYNGNGIDDRYETQYCGDDCEQYITETTERRRGGGNGGDGGGEDTDDLNVIEEYSYGTNPLIEDTDGDGLTDSDEVDFYNTDPLNWDTDGDGLSDGDEVNIYGTDPLNPDTDGDQVLDGSEVQFGTDPLNKEKYPDDDGDGIPNDWELANGLDPNNPDDASLDNDNDGLTNLEEYNYGTDPNDIDTDKDGLKDGEEVKVYNTNPLNPDTDGDTLLDGFYEILYEDSLFSCQTDPLKVDTDADGFKDDLERTEETNPCDFESKPELISEEISEENCFDSDGGDFLPNGYVTTYDPKAPSSDFSIVNYKDYCELEGLERDEDGNCPGIFIDLNMFYPLPDIEMIFFPGYGEPFEEHYFPGKVYFWGIGKACEIIPFIDVGTTAAIQGNENGYITYSDTPEGSIEIPLVGPVVVEMACLSNNNHRSIWYFFNPDTSPPNPFFISGTVVYRTNGDLINCGTTINDVYINSRHYDGTWIAVDTNNDGTLEAYGFAKEFDNYDTLFPEEDLTKLNIPTSEGLEIWKDNDENIIYIREPKQFGSGISFPYWKYCGVDSGCTEDYSELNNAELSTLSILSYAEKAQEFCFDGINYAVCTI